MRALAIASVLIIALFLIFPDIDLQVSGLFFDKQQNLFPYRDTLFSNIIYMSVRAVTVLVLLYYGIHIAESIRRKYMPKFLPVFKDMKVYSMKACLYIIAIIIITPGILVHNVMKPLWDRARPVNVVEFGGVKTFTPAFHFSNQGENSFPSGHAAMAFILIGFAFLQPTREKFLRVYKAAFIYGIIASVCRIWMGGHFLSDVTVAALLSIFTAHAGYYVIFGKEEYYRHFKKTGSL